MSKDSFIWLIIRAAGVYSLIAFMLSLTSFVSVSLAALFAKNSGPAGMYLPGFLSLLFRSSLLFLLTAYLLFFGKFVWRVIDKFSELHSADDLQIGNYAEIMIRFAAMVQLKAVLFMLSGVITNIFITPIYSVIHSKLSYMQVVKNAMLSNLINPLYWTPLIVYGLLIWYLLKGGQFLVDLLDRRWPEKEPSTIAY